VGELERTDEANRGYELAVTCGHPSIHTSPPVTPSDFDADRVWKRILEICARTPVTVIDSHYDLFASEDP
jgi:hypothetical protein